jgi:DNA-binding CsgD family transcriptional regulator
MGDLIIDKGQSEKFFITYIKNRIRENKNFLGIITGPTGSGKSLSAVSICEQVDPSFDVNRIVFSIKDLMALINSGQLKSGSCILFDEAGIEFSNRNWQSTINKALSSLLQTFRHQCLIVFFTVPYLDFVDTSVRKLFHAELTTMGIDKANKICKIKPQLIQYNSRNKKFYYKYLRIKSLRGVAPLRSWGITIPSKELLDRYEEVKQEFTWKLNKDIEKDIQKQEQIVPLTQKQEQAFLLMKKLQDTNLVAAEMNESQRGVQYHLAACRRKGYVLEKGNEVPIL